MRQFAVVSSRGPATGKVFTSQDEAEKYAHIVASSFGFPQRVVELITICTVQPHSLDDSPERAQ